jgi:ATP-dependent protease ClpP protease subunit
MARDWFSISARANEVAEILIYDEIGSSLFSEGVSAKSFVEELRSVGPVREIVLGINSPGGDVFDAHAIYNALRNHSAKVSVRIDGIAASAASVVAMAGDHISMPQNAMMMIHDPVTIAAGTEEDFLSMASALAKAKTGIRAAYGRTGLADDKLKSMMAAETWMLADEAVDLGFADEVVGAVQLAASATALARYKNVPAALFAALAPKEKHPRSRADMARRCAQRRVRNARILKST